MLFKQKKKIKSRVVFKEVGIKLIKLNLYELKARTGW